MQNSASIDSCVMARLFLVKGLMVEAKVNNDALHGAKVLLEVILLWIITNRIACADSFFTPVVSAELIHTRGS